MAKRLELCQGTLGTIDLIEPLEVEQRGLTRLDLTSSDRQDDNSLAKLDRPLNQEARVNTLNLRRYSASLPPNSIFASIQPRYFCLYNQLPDFFHPG